LKLTIANRLCVVECECESKRSVGMHTSPDRVSLLRKKRPVRVAQRLGKRFQVLGPSFSIRVVPRVQFFCELQRPRPPVSTFERLAVRLLHVSNFLLNVLRGEICIQRLTYL